MTDCTLDALFAFLRRSPTAFHAAANLRQALCDAGYVPLREEDAWELKPGGKYFVTRNGSAVIAFRVPGAVPEGFHIIASHSDSPTFKLKPGGALRAGDLTRLNVERYGGAIVSSWFDRPLSVAGRVLLQEGGSLREKLVALDRDLLMIPSLAIHLSKGMTGETQLQTELLPIIGGADASLADVLADALGVKPEQIADADLYLYNRQAPTVWGADQAFIASPRLDDLECCWCSLQGFLQSADSAVIPVHCVFDNEEVGSRTRQGAAAGFLRDTLERITLSLGLGREDWHRLIARSFLLSADNAHAFHPGYPDRADPVNHPRMNGGVVIKYHAEQRYATDAVSAAIVKTICRAHDIPYQIFTNHSDITGGSTLGNLSSAQLPLRTADIGLAQLAMHACFETAGRADIDPMVRLSKAFYSEALPTVAPDD